jgi:hypothetical protein
MGLARTAKRARVLMLERNAVGGDCWRENAMTSCTSQCGAVTSRLGQTRSLHHHTAHHGMPVTACDLLQISNHLSRHLRVQREQIRGGEARCTAFPEPGHDGG